MIRYEFDAQSFLLSGRALRTLGVIAPPISPIAEAGRGT